MTKMILFITALFTMHPIHVSVVSINFNEDKNDAEIVFKIFTDDLVTVINRKYNKDYNIKGEDKSEQLLSNIKEYISEHFDLRINEKSIDNKLLEYKKIKRNFEATWIHFKFSNYKEVKNIKVKSTILNDLYLDQKNLILINYKDFHDGEKLDLKKNEVVFNINK